MNECEASYEACRQLFKAHLCKKVYIISANEQDYRKASLNELYNVKTEELLHRELQIMLNTLSENNYLSTDVEYNLK